MRGREMLLKAVTCGMLLGALLGCHAAPVPSHGVALGAEHGRGGLALAVQMRTPRRLQAFTEQVAQVAVEVKAANGARFEQRLSVTSGEASTTIDGLVPGGASISLRALDAADRLLGEASREVVIESGAVTALTMPLRLDHPLPSAPALAMPAGALPNLGASKLDLVVPYGFHQLSADPTGAIWLHGEGLLELGLDGSERQQLPIGWGGSVAVDGTGRLWVSDGSIRLYDADGSPVWQIANMSGRLAVEADGHALIAEGDVKRVSPTGQVVDVFDIPATLLAVAPGSGNIWAIDNRAILRQYAPDGQLLSRTMIPVEQAFIDRWNPWYPGWDGRRYWMDELAVDAEGNAWLVGIDEAKVSKVGADGTLLGEYVVCVEPSAVTVDRQGNIWVGGRGAGEHNLVKLAPDGTMLGTLTVSPRITALETDVDGDIWVAYENLPFVTRVTP